MDRITQNLKSEMLFKKIVSNYAPVSITKQILRNVVKYNIVIICIHVNIV